jgi:pilus assembly protein CpaE
MAEIRLRVAIVDPSEMNRTTLANMLLGLETEGVWLEADCPRYEFFPEVVSQSNPDVAILALDADQARALQLLEQLRREHPDLLIVALSSRDDVLLQAYRRNAQELLKQPVEMGDLQDVLMRIGGAGANRESNKGKVIAFLGSRGGVGCTSLAVNLGGALAHDKRNKVVLIDLDLVLGDTDVLLDLMPDYTLTDVINSGDRLDMSILKRSLTEHKASGLLLLPHPVQMQDISLIQEDEENLRRLVELPRVVERVIGLLRSSYTHLLVDLSKGLTPTDLTVLHLADVVLLIAQLELTSLRNVVRLMHTLGTEAAFADKIKVVLNRVGSDYMGGEISVKRAEETIEKPVFWQVPNDAKSVLGARNAFVLLGEHAPRSKVNASIQGLARALGGHENSQPLKPRAKKGWFG